MRVIIFLLVSCSSWGAFAQQIDTLSSQTFDLDPVVLTAFEPGQSLLKQSGSVSVLGVRELTRDQDLIIANALNRVPGLLMHN
ncbi:MAG: hypothetical protein AB8H47_27475, partial [Bacteroidia bacterium]